MNFKQLQTEIHEHNKNVGWWDTTDQWTVLTKLMLTVTELAEATEGDRKNLMDDKLPNREMLEVELADTMIRILDLGGHLKFEIDPVIEMRIEQQFKKYQPLIPVPVLLFDIVMDIVDFARYRNASRYAQLIVSVHTVSAILNLDLYGAMADKRAFNATRADHKRSNRVKAHGKTY
jgi:NTP pyrophosphatase (non-canonical NTP hydrolase)